LGHNSKAVHRAYAKRALMEIPSLENYEKAQKHLACESKFNPQDWNNLDPALKN
jgi:hypothetical protein